MNSEEKRAVVFTDYATVGRYIVVALEQERINVVHLPKMLIREDTETALAFMNAFQPQLVLYDIPPPYKDNWNELKVNRFVYEKSHVVIISTGNEILQEIKQENPTFQILPVPFTYEQLLDSVLSFEGRVHRERE